MILLQGLTKHFGEKKAVDNISLEIEPGEVFGFLGPNGAGKSTTVKMLAGMLKPTAGRAEVAGYDVASQPLEVKKRIGYVPESGALFEALTISEHLDLFANLHHIPTHLANRRIPEFLNLFELDDVKTQPLHSLSKGTKQKVVLTAALLHNPQVLFLDEPFNGLDANVTLTVKDLLRRLTEQGKTILFCSHILEVVERICTRIAIIHNGHIVAQGTSTELMTQTSEPSLEQAFHKLTVTSRSNSLTENAVQALGEI